MFSPLDLLTLFGSAAGAVAGWTWDKVIQGIFVWFANGLLLLMEWVWGVLDTASTPRLTDDWFASGLFRPLASLAVGITIAMMLMSAVQAGVGGRPELIIDALKEGPKAILATSLTIVVMDVLIRAADAISAVVWQAGRTDAQKVLDGLAATVAASGTVGSTFLGPLAVLFGIVGFLMTTVVLLMRSSLLYLVAAFSPIVWSASVSPILRGAGRRLVQVAVALVLGKPAITVTLIVGAKLLANTVPTAGTLGGGGAAALGTLLSGFSCIAIAGLSPWVVYRLLPTVEGATMSSGIVGGWARGAMSVAQATLLVKSAGASAGASAATRALPMQQALASNIASGAGQSAGAGRSTRGAGSSSAGGGASTRPTGGGSSPSPGPRNSNGSPAAPAGGQRAPQRPPVAAPPAADDDRSASAAEDPS